MAFGHSFTSCLHQSGEARGLDVSCGTGRWCRFLHEREKIQDQAPHVFSRTIDGWREAFESSGFRNVGTRRYDHSVFVRLYSRLTQPLAGMLRPHRSTVSTLTPEKLAALRDSRNHRFWGFRYDPSPPSSPEQPPVARKRAPRPSFGSMPQKVPTEAVDHRTLLREPTMPT
jgi:hypothetical protein